MSSKSNTPAPVKYQPRDFDMALAAALSAPARTASSTGKQGMSLDDYVTAIIAACNNGATKNVGADTVLAVRPGRSSEGGPSHTEPVNVAQTLNARNQRAGDYAAQGRTEEAERIASQPILTVWSEQPSGKSRLGGAFRAMPLADADFHGVALLNRLMAGQGLPGKQGSEERTAATRTAALAVIDIANRDNGSAILDQVAASHDRAAAFVDLFVQREQPDTGGVQVEATEADAS